MGTRMVSTQIFGIEDAPAPQLNLPGPGDTFIVLPGGKAVARTVPSSAFDYFVHVSGGDARLYVFRPAYVEASEAGWAEADIQRLISQVCPERADGENIPDGVYFSGAPGAEAVFRESARKYWDNAFKAWAEANGSDPRIYASAWNTAALISSAWPRAGRLSWEVIEDADDGEAHAYSLADAGAPGAPGVRWQLCNPQLPSGHGILYMCVRVLEPGAPASLEVAWGPGPLAHAVHVSVPREAGDYSWSLMIYPPLHHVRLWGNSNVCVQECSYLHPYHAWQEAFGYAPRGE